MNYPLISEYVESILCAEDNFDELSALRPVLAADGTPVMSSGNFAVVFKMTDGTKDYAVKCFTKEQEGRDEAYRLIAEELKYVQSSYLVSLRYLPKELFVSTSQTDEEEFPVVVMDWVEGINLDAYVRRHIDDSYAMSLLAYQFSRLASWLLSQPFAHGDLKPDNILVRDDGTLVLVDYDGMYVPSMRGTQSRELGSPDYRHPLRTATDFDEHTDDFALTVLALSLKALALSPDLLPKSSDHQSSQSPDHLLFTASDYRDLSASPVLPSLRPLLINPELERLLALFLLAHSQQTLPSTAFQLFSLSRPAAPKRPIEKVVEVVSTEVTEEDLKEGVKDECGVLYSKDGKRLLKGADIRSYKIKEGTLAICDSAFYYCKALEAIHIPDSVTSIGDAAFWGCSVLKAIHIPDSLTSIGDAAFWECSALKAIHIPDGVTSIGDAAFWECSALKAIHIPDGVTSIGSSFEGCSALESIHIPDSVTSIGYSAFGECSALKEIHIPDGVTSIGDLAFSGCSALKEFHIPDSVTSIGDWAFSGCRALKEFHIPDSVTSIGYSAFGECSALKAIHIPHGTTQKFRSLLPEDLHSLLIEGE